jgi:hypothetical protein
MTEKTDNELIAEFMGFCMPDGERYYVVPAEYKNLTYNEDIIEDNNRQLFFSESWDWLMPVVAKIEQTLDPQVYAVEIHIGAGCRIYADGKDFDVVGDGIECVHQAVVDFIKWYNETKQP